MTSLSTDMNRHHGDEARRPSDPQAEAATDAVIDAVMRVQRRLSWIIWARAVLVSIAAGLITWNVCRLALHVGWFGGEPFAAVTAIIVGCGLLIAMRLRAGTVTLERAALWVEEHGPGHFAIATWVEQWRSSLPRSPLLAAMIAKAAREPLERSNLALSQVARTQLRWPITLVVGALLLAASASRTTSTVERVVDGTGEAAAARTAARATPIGAWRVRITPPAYSGQPSVDLGDVASLRALAGSRIDVVGGGALPDRVLVRALSDTSQPPVRAALRDTAGASNTAWATTVMATSGPLDVRVWRDQFARLLLIEGVADSLPRVTLTAPPRDSVLRTATGSLPLAARLHDDLGLMRAEFEVIVSTGEGEKFTVRTERVASRALGDAREATLQGTLNLASLALGPGDMVHVRAIARDAHPAAGREAGSSETRSFRIARPSEYDSIAVEPAPPPEVDKSLLSQRMLLLLTERLDRKRPQLSKDVLRDESRKLARDQGRLRQAVGDAVFQRLTGEAGGEHSHSADDGHDHGVEAIGGKLALSGVNSQGMLEEGDDSPVIAINKPLLEAYNAMWDAGRALEQSDPHAAIPFMRIALEAIERARAASRLYLRGKPPAVILDLAKIRLAGKDTGSVNSRTARDMLPPTAAAREGRLLAAARLTLRDASAARDSLALLRLESLSDAPAFADALAALLTLYRADSAAVDLTDAFVRARRVLGGITRVPDANWSRGGPP